MYSNDVLVVIHHCVFEGMISAETWSESPRVRDPWRTTGPGGARREDLLYSSQTLGVVEMVEIASTLDDLDDLGGETQFRKPPFAD